MNPVLLSVAISEATQHRGFMNSLWWHLHTQHGATVANDAIVHILTQHGGKRLAVPTADELVKRNKRRIDRNAPTYESLKND